MELTENTIIREIKTSGRLPSPTGVALSILELTRDPDTSTEDMALVLVGDPSLTGQILKYANSSSGRSRGEVTTLNEALVRLGMSMVRQLCLGFSVLSNSRTGPCIAFDYSRYWSYSLAMAVSSQSLCRKMGSVSPDEAFTCGLLSKIGQLAMASVYSSHYTNILEEWGEESLPELLEIEARELSINHNQVSTILFDDWGLPDTYCIAVEAQENTEWEHSASGRSTKDRGMQLGRILHISQLAASICLEEVPLRHALVLKFMKFGEELGYSDEEWTEVYDEILAEWEHLGQMLNIHTTAVPDMNTLLQRAQEFNGTIPPKKKSRRTQSGQGQSGADAEVITEANTLAENDFGDEESHLPGTLDILVATDSPLDMRILEKKLIGAGHRMLRADDGVQALEMALNSSPQVILTDWRMPRLDGLELTKSLRQSTQASGTYIIIMTAQEGNDELVEAFDAGIDDYITKPLNHRILTARLKAASRLVALQHQVARDRAEVLRTVAEMGILNRKLHTMALEDQLTQLPNRRSGLDHLDKEWARTSRTQESLLVMVLDIDHFKLVNDNHGHDAGDVVLRSTAQTMKNCMRDSDVVCRFGGEEFLVICPGADVEMAKLIGNRLRKAIENNVMDTPEFKGNVTISIGVAVRGETQATPADLIKEADEALYAAKEAGRNLVCIAGPD